MHRQHAIAARAPRHPFRATIAPGPRALARPRAANPDDSDLKLFVLSFTAFFICIYTLIF